MGRSNPDDEVCRQTPRSADPEITPKLLISNNSRQCETIFNIKEQTKYLAVMDSHQQTAT